jgi:hypothetical protein
MNRISILRSAFVNSFVIPAILVYFVTCVNFAHFGDLWTANDNDGAGCCHDGRPASSASRMDRTYSSNRTQVLLQCKSQEIDISTTHGRSNTNSAHPSNCATTRLNATDARKSNRTSSPIDRMECRSAPPTRRSARGETNRSSPRPRYVGITRRPTS